LIPFLRCSYSYNHNSQFTVASSHRCEETVDLWPGCQPVVIYVASVSEKYYVLGILFVELCSLAAVVFFSNRTVFPVLNVFLELPRAWIYHCWLFPKIKFLTV
jgi:hypothetical protein